MEVDEVDAIYQLLRKLPVLDERDILTVVNTILCLLRGNSFSPQAWFNLLLFILEREHESIARHNVIKIIHELVLRERRLRDVVRKEISTISHAADTGTTSHAQVRIFLHQCIFEWIEAGIVTTEFLKRLQRQEETWEFRSERPRYTATPEGSPCMFDLVLLGIQGRQQRLDDVKINMRELVREGMVRGVREGWMRVDERGRHVVRMEVSQVTYDTAVATSS